MTTQYTFIFLSLLHCLQVHVHASDTETLQIGIASSLNKVFQSKPYNFKGSYSQEAEIELAINEYEATQLVLFPKKDFTCITINAGPLTHENKIDTINSDLIQLNPIGFVNLKGGEKIKGRTGFHPDTLLPN